MVPRLVVSPLRAAFLALALVAANVFWQYASAPSGLLLSPVVAIMACYLVLHKASPWHPYPKAGLCAGLLVLQDVGIKLYGGGDHDLEGQGIVNVLFIIGALLSLVLLIMALRRDGTHATQHKVGAIGLFLAVLVGHLLVFSRLGMGRYVGIYVE